MDVCVGNWGYYNEGELRDAWISLPVSDKELQDFLVENGLYDKDHEETYISDYDGYPFGLDNLFHETTRLEDLNLLAKQMELYPDAVDKLEHISGWVGEQVSSITGLMNLIAQEDEIYCDMYDAYTDSPEENYGIFYLDEVLDADQALKSHFGNNYVACSLYDAIDAKVFGETLANYQDVYLGKDYAAENFSGDLDKYSQDELKEMITKEWDKKHLVGDKESSLSELAKQLGNVSEKLNADTPSITTHER